MDQKRYKQFQQFLSRYFYIILVLILGVGLMMLPGTDDQKAVKESYEKEPVNQKQACLEDTLSAMLSQLEGAGKVRVLLSISEGERTIFQTNQDGTRTDTVIINDNSRNQTGLISQVDPPKYLGAVVLCQGANSPTVRLAVTQAVANATGLSYDRISILKMK